MMTSTSYPQSSKDWKGVFISYLLDALANCSHLKLSFWGPPGERPENVNYLCTSAESSWFVRVMEQGGIARLIREKKPFGLFVVLKLLYLLKKTYKDQQQASLYHVNWLQNALPLLGTKTPALITVLGSDYGMLKLPGMTTMLRHVLKNRRCVLAPNAEWMKLELEKRFGDVAQVIPIPFGIDNEWFAVKRECNKNKHKWLVVSRITQKKIGPLFEWGEAFFRKKRQHELHLFGPMQEQISIPDWIQYHGPTYPQDLSNTWFPKAVGLITLSKHDEGRPQVMLEAMAAGLPIIASNLPAHRDVLIHRETGLLVNSQSDFEREIEWLAVPENNQLLSIAAREWVKREIGSWQDCSKRYLNVYQMLLDGVD